MVSDTTTDAQIRRSIQNEKEEIVSYVHGGG